MADLEALAAGFASFILTYLVHSTALIALGWVVASGGRIKSHILLDRLWKVVASLGLLTAMLQTIAALGTAVDMAGLPQAQGAHEARLRKSAEPSASLSPGFIHDSRQDPIYQVGVVTGEEFARSLQTDQTSASVAVNSDETAVLRSVDSAPARGQQSDTGFTANNSLRATLRSGSNAHGTITLFSPRMRFPHDLAHMFSIVGAIVILSGVARVIWKLLNQRRSLRSFTSCYSPAQAALNRLLRKSRICRPIHLLVSGENDEPFACGLVNWTIVVPQGIEARLSKDELSALLAHEIAHLVRGDVYWLWIGQVLCTCFAFQPLNFLARRRWQRSAEFLCDDWAVERGVPCLALARCLTHVAEWRLNAQAPQVGLAARGTTTTLVQRVNRLVDSRRHLDRWTTSTSRTWINLTTVLLIFAVVILAPHIGFAELPDQSRAPHDANSVNSSTISNSVHAPPVWRSLCEELIALEADVEHANELLSSVPSGPRVESLVNNIRHRTSALSARSEKLSHLFGKEPTK